jgi:hypothetical protein
MSNKVQTEKTSFVIGLFELQSKSFKDGKVTVELSRQFSKRGNITEKIELNFAKLFFGQVCKVVNELNGHSGKTPLSDEKYFSHKKLIDLILTAKSVNDLFVGVNDGETPQKKIATLQKNIKALCRIDDAEGKAPFLFTNANLLAILKAAAKCYKLTTAENPVVVKKAAEVEAAKKAAASGKGKGKAADKGKDAAKTAPRKNWFKFVAGKGIKNQDFGKLPAKKQKALKAEFAAL